MYDPTTPKVDKTQDKRHAYRATYAIQKKKSLLALKQAWRRSAGGRRKNRRVAAWLQQHVHVMHGTETNKKGHER